MVGIITACVFTAVAASGDIAGSVVTRCISSVVVPPRVSASAPAGDVAPIGSTPVVVTANGIVAPSLLADSVSVPLSVSDDFNLNTGNFA